MHTTLQVCQGVSIPRTEPMLNEEGRVYLPSLVGRLEACLSHAIVEDHDSSASSLYQKPPGHCVNGVIATTMYSLTLMVT